MKNLSLALLFVLGATRLLSALACEQSEKSFIASSAPVQPASRVDSGSSDRKSLTVAPIRPAPAAKSPATSPKRPCSKLPGHLFM